MAIRIALCDDEREMISYTHELVASWAHSAGILVEIEEFSSAEAFLFAHEEEHFDILLLDIEMGAMNGVELARRIRQKDRYLQIIFITGFSDYIGEGYDVMALHYLIKPVSPEKLREVLSVAAEKLRERKRYLMLNIDRECVRIDFDDIRYIESSGHYLNIVTVKDEFRVKMTLSDVEKRLDHGFFRCQRSFIVGLLYIERMTRTAVFLKGGIEIPLARGLYDEINHALIKFF